MYEYVRVKAILLAINSFYKIEKCIARASDCAPCRSCATTARWSRSCSRSRTRASTWRWRRGTACSRRRSATSRARRSPTSPPPPTTSSPRCAGRRRCDVRSHVLLIPTLPTRAQPACCALDLTTSICAVTLFPCKFTFTLERFVYVILDCSNAGSLHD